MSKPRYLIAGALIAGCLAIAANAAVVNQVVNTVAVGGITGLGTGVATALGINVGSAGAPVLFNGAGGTPSSIALTNATALPCSAMPALTGGATTSAGSCAVTAKAPLGGNSANATVAAGQTVFVTTVLNASEGVVFNFAPFAGTFKNLYFGTNVAPGVGETYTATWRTNVSDTAITCTISGNASTGCNDTTHTGTIAAGQVYSLKVVASGGAASALIIWGIEVDY